MVIVEAAETEVEEAAANISPWKAVGASVQGASHVKTGQPCQDAHLWERLTDGTLILAVADGAGTATLGEVGSNVAVHAAVQELKCALEREDHSPNTSDIPPPLSCEACWHNLLQRALISAREALTVEAWEREVSMRDLATTLLLAVVTPEWVAVAQIGDGAVVIGDAEGSLEALTRPDSGEFINQTTFLTSAHAVETAQIVLWQGEAAHIAAFTDGLQMLALKMPDGTPHPAFFGPLFRFASAADEDSAPDELASFLRSPRVTHRTDDDLTLLLAAREGHA